MTEGEQQAQQGVVGSVTAISNKLITTLPSAMLLTILLNIAFLGCLFWLLAAQNASRERALIPLLEACSRTVPLDAMKYFIPRTDLPP